MRVRVGTDTADIMAHLSGGLSDTAFASVTAARFQQDGFIVNPITGLDTGRRRYRGPASALRLLPSDSVEINFSADYSRDRKERPSACSFEDPSRAINFIPQTGTPETPATALLSITFPRKQRCSGGDFSVPADQHTGTPPIQ